jgi:hypothetical protein
LADAKTAQSVPLLPLLHHILVRSPLPLPHRAHGWSEAEYVSWINKHEDGERVQLVMGVVTEWEETHADGEGAEHISLLRQVIARSKATNNA